MYTTHPLKPSDWKELYPDNLDLAWVIPLRLTLAGKEMLLAEIVRLRGVPINCAAGENDLCQSLLPTLLLDRATYS
jgi:hypothetical protein